MSKCKCGVDFTRKAGHRCGVRPPKFTLDEYDKIDEAMNKFKAVKERLLNEKDSKSND